MDWLEILKTHKGLEFFFDVSVTAAIEKNECFGHVLLICDDAVIRRHFAEELVNLLQPLAVNTPTPSMHGDSSSSDEQAPAISVYATIIDRTTKANEIAALLTRLWHRDVALVDRDIIELSAECSEVLGLAMDTFALDIVIGSGPNAQSVRLDLPEFTFIMCTASESAEVKRFEPHFSYVIRIEKSELADLSKKTAIMKAQEEGYSLADDALEYLAKCASFDCMTVASYTARVIECMKHHAIGTQITYEHVEDVLCKLGIRPETATSKTEQESDMQLLLKDIHRQLVELRRDITLVKASLDELKGNRAKYSVSEIGEKLDGHRGRET